MLGCVMQEKKLTLQKINVGPTPFIDQVLEKIRFRDILGKHLNNKRHLSAIEILIKSLLVEPAALYRIPQLSKQYGWEEQNLSDDMLA